MYKKAYALKVVLVCFTEGFDALLEALLPNVSALAKI